jgi:hypothetical protein
MWIQNQIINKFKISQINKTLKIKKIKIKKIKIYKKCLEQQVKENEEK